MKRGKIEGRGIIGLNDFRYVLGKLLFIENKDLFTAELSKIIEIREEDTGVLMLSYYDEKQGMMFAVLGAGYAEEDDFVCGNRCPAGTVYALGYYHFENRSYMRISKDFDDEEIQANIKMIENHYSISEKNKKFMAIKDLDGWRAPNFPNDLKVVLSKQGCRLESVWVGLTDILSEDEMKGILLNDVTQSELGVKRGETILFSKKFISSSESESIKDLEYALIAEL